MVNPRDPNRLQPPGSSGGGAVGAPPDAKLPGYYRRLRVLWRPWPRKDTIACRAVTGEETEVYRDFPPILEDHWPILSADDGGNPRSISMERARPDSERRSGFHGLLHRGKNPAGRAQCRTLQRGHAAESPVGVRNRFRHPARAFALHSPAIRSSAFRAADFPAIRGSLCALEPAEPGYALRDRAVVAAVFGFPAPDSALGVGSGAAGVLPGLYQFLARAGRNLVAAGFCSWLSRA